jgi:hypothetical protein
MFLNLYKIRILLIVPCFFLLAASTPSHLDVATWREFTSKEGRFSVRMPGRPTMSLKRDETPVGEVVSRIYTYENTVISLTAEYSDLPGVAVIFGGRKRIYDKSRDAFLKDAEGHEIASLGIRLDAYRGMELIYETATQYGKARFILIGKRLYVLQAAMAKGADDRAPIDRYLDTFKPVYRKGRGHHHAGI